MTSEISTDLGQTGPALKLNAAHSAKKDAQGDKEREKDEDVNRIREVLLGSQLREQERRSGRFEDKLLKELTLMRAELMGRMEALERHVNSEVESLTQRWSQENRDRQNAEKQVVDDLHQVKSALLKDIEALRATTSKAERDLRQALLEASKNFASDLHRMHDDLSAELAMEVNALEDSKVARSSLAAMLSESVVRLNGEGGGGRLDR